tara:strand:- start:21594 stop:22175 length:582 start_codon:yes stop_codon:yes gene_type:complete
MTTSLLPVDRQRGQHHNNLIGSNILSKEKMNEKAHNTEKGLTRIKLDSPIITVPEIKPRKTRVLTKDFKDEIDIGFKTRSSQLSDSNFKDMPRIIRVKDCEITGHYIPGFTTSKNDLHLKPREFEKIHKKNEFGFDRTGTKEITTKKINPEDVVHRVEQKNKFNKTGFTARETGDPTPIVQIQQHRKKLIIKH